MADTASALFLGKRDLQQDSVASYNHPPTGVTLLALSDGIGGAGNGHLASRLIVRSAMASLKTHLSEIAMRAEAVSEVLHMAALAANRTLGSTVAEHPDKAGMGGTLLLAAISNGQAHTLSIGDSLIYQFRENALSQVNKVHSLAGNVDNLAALGRIDAATAKKMAARSTLTSALTGEKLVKVDVPVAGVDVRPGDLLLMASDGIETLGEDQIANVLADSHGQGAATVAANLISAIEAADTSDQDNVSVSVAIL